jgi:hypothetical protein
MRGRRRAKHPPLMTAGRVAQLLGQPVPQGADFGRPARDVWLEERRSASEAPKPAQKPRRRGPDA